METIQEIRDADQRGPLASLPSAVQALTAAAAYAPLSKEDCGMWQKEWLDDGVIDASLIVWDDRGFVCIYIDGIRQIPVRHLDEHVKWLGRIDSHTQE